MLIIYFMVGLTAMQIKFINEYKLCGVATTAAIKAGYSPNGASVAAHRLMNVPKIKKIIQESIDKKKKKLSRAGISQEIINSLENVSAEAINSLPSKIQYAAKAWERSSDESKLKEETKFKYFENAGRVLGHVKNEESVNVNIISADTLESMRSTLMNRGKIVNVSSVVNPVITTPPNHSINIPIGMSNSASSQSSDIVMPEKSAENLSGGGGEEPQAPL